MPSSLTATPVYATSLGRILHDDCLDALAAQESGTVDLIVTSPPFGLLRQKDYGNVEAEEYVRWFRRFGCEFRRVLADSGSLVIDIGGAWNRGYPTRSLYHFKLLVDLCETVGFHLAQEFYWWNPSKLPTPAEWVTVRRVRVKDAVNPVWWLSKTEWPKAGNRRVLQPYSEAMNTLLANGYTPKQRPSGHNISDRFSEHNGGSIPPNLIAVANTESNSRYLRYCQDRGMRPHPARFPAELPEFFVRLLTDSGDLVIDPFAGSCTTGEVCERLGRRWVCVEVRKDYCEAALGRFTGDADDGPQPTKPDTRKVYQIARPGMLWDTTDTAEAALAADGGRRRA